MPCRFRHILSIRAAEHDVARAILSAGDLDVPTGRIGHNSHVLAVQAHLEVAAGTTRAYESVRSAKAHAQAQSAGRWTAYCEALEAVVLGPEALNRFIRITSRRDGWLLSYVAELIAARLESLGDLELSAVQEEALRRARRWRPALRKNVDAGGSASLHAARMLEPIGERQDVSRLRRVAHQHRGKPDFELGRELARRIADRVFVEDQGRVAMLIGSRAVDGSSIRRKVLALLCFLVCVRGSRQLTTR